MQIDRVGLATQLKDEHHKTDIVLFGSGGSIEAAGPLEQEHPASFQLVGCSRRRFHTAL
jgi:hypothetical protein